MPDVHSTVLSAVRSQGIRYVRFTWSDNAGLIRAKAVHTAFLADFLEGNRVGVTIACQALPVMYDAVAPDSGLTPAGEVFLQPDWATFTPIPGGAGQARVLTDIYLGDQPWSHCPRTFLRRMLGRTAERGLRVMAAFENEFNLLRADGATWAPADTTVFCQTSALDQLGPVLNEITAALEAQGIIVEMVYPEAGPGQFEMPVRYVEGLAAADQQLVFRETVRAAAARSSGLVASFVPKIFPDKAGNGAHLHLSLWRDDQNLTPDPQRPGELSAESAAFAAGILQHLPGLMAITTPSPNSFKRIRPGFWSGAYICWGHGNREAPLRLPPVSIPGRPVSNFELKTVDPSCNPYLALGAVLAAGLDGLNQGLALGEAVDVDPGTLSEAERQRRGIRPLPTSLGEALAALDADGVLREALGPDLARSFLAVRRAEWDALKDLPHDEEVRLLLERY
jgi:glutamine synthetase